MFNRSLSAGLLGCAIALAAGTCSWAQPSCPPGRNPPVAAAALKQRLGANKQAVIVALGSSSTEGWMASSVAASYPSILQADLNSKLQNAHLVVINRGVGGQDALEEMARLDTDVLAIKPDMVIWQVGANGAMEHSDPAVFIKLVSTGIQRMKALGIDVVLMDNQRSPMILASPVHGLMEQALADLSVKYNVALFSRGTLMDGWKRNGFDYGLFLANDNVHMNDRGYRCVADALAASIEEGLGVTQDKITVAHASN